MLQQVTVTVNKPAADSTIGLSLNYYDGGKILARTILDDGLFTNTELQAGFILLSVNGVDVKGMSTPQVMKLFVDAEPGDITVVAEDVGLRIASFVKDSSIPKIGIGLKERNGSILISSIAEDGMIAKHSNIKVGQRLLGVNGVPCKSLSSREAIALFKELDALTVMTEDIGLTSVTVKKDSPTAKIGIGLKTINGHLIISSIAEDGLFANTELKCAQKLMSVNATYCDTLSKVEAVNLLKSAEDSLTLVTEDIGLISVSVTKETVDSKLGIALSDINGKIVITSVAPDGVFADSPIVPGLRLLCINTTLCKGMSKADAITILKETVGVITIIAEEVGLITAVGVKETPEMKIGIGLKDMSGNVIVSSIAEDSVFLNTPLKVGHKILSINKVNIDGLDKYEAIKLFKNVEGAITVMAEDVGLVGATVMKPSADTKVGIGIKEVDGDLYISSIYDSGLFTKSDLREDMKIVSVNRKSVRGMNKVDAIKLIKESEGELSVIAQAM
jgi:C-terminal processing protease CtpA/Prc